MTNGNVLGFLAAPDRQVCLRAISLALLKVRAHDGMTCEKLGKAIDCSADTVRNASNEEALLSFDCVARLCYYFPEETGSVQQLWAGPVEAPTVDERFERIERELIALRKVAA